MVRLAVGLAFVVAFGGLGAVGASCNGTTNVCDCPSCSHPYGACPGETLPSFDGGADADATTDARGDAGADASEAGPVADCVQKGDVYVCQDSDAAIAACPASANEQQPCNDTSGASCMGCEDILPPSGLGAGFTCRCVDAGLVPAQDAALWECIGTEHTCK